MKLPYLLLVFILCGHSVLSFTDPIDRVASLIRQGNIHELSKLFGPSIEIAILDEENVYTKASAELILEKFFDQNKPKAVKLLHRVNSNQNYQFGVLIVTTHKGVFRIACTLKQTDGNLTLIEMRIDAEKVK